MEQDAIQDATVEVPAPAAATTDAAPKPAHKRVSHPKATAAESPGAKPSVYWGIGRRKESIARVRLFQGAGTIVINTRPYDLYFPRELLRLSIRQPLVVTHQLGKYDVRATATGGGLSGQAGAVRLGIARALLLLDPTLRPSLRAAGLLTRDPRAKERKKYGQKGARKRFQWTKR